jgi:hypothetical protein
MSVEGPFLALQRLLNPELVHVEKHVGVVVFKHLPLG